MDLFMLMGRPPEGGEGGGNPFLGFLPIILIFGIFYMLVIRPHSRKQKVLREQIEALKQGDRVVTSGGLYGTVVGDKDQGNTFVIKIADQVKVEVAKSGIASVVKKAKES